jgi:hypothetical protein
MHGKPNSGTTVSNSVSAIAKNPGDKTNAWSEKLCYCSGITGIGSPDSKCQCASVDHVRRATPVSIRILQLRSLWVRPDGLLRARLFLQWCLSGGRPVGLLGVPPRLGQLPLSRAGRRALLPARRLLCGTAAERRISAVSSPNQPLPTEG